MQAEIPCPRLELEWIMTGDDWRQRECVYSLVFPLQEYDVRREDEDGNKIRSEYKAEIGRTRCSGGRGEAPIWPEDGTVHTPYRDGAHAQFDSAALGGMIPIVAVCGDVFNIIDQVVKE